MTIEKLNRETLIEFLWKEFGFHEMNGKMLMSFMDCLLNSFPTIYHESIETWGALEEMCIDDFLFSEWNITFKVWHNQDGKELDVVMVHPDKRYPAVFTYRTL